MEPAGESPLNGNAPAALLPFTALSKTERKRLARNFWRSLEGCDCPAHIDGKPLKRNERCTTDAIRCNGRLAAVKQKFDDAGLNWGSKEP